MNLNDKLNLSSFHALLLRPGFQLYGRVLGQRLCIIIIPAAAHQSRIFLSLRSLSVRGLVCVRYQKMREGPSQKCICGWGGWVGVCFSVRRRRLVCGVRNSDPGGGDALFGPWVSRPRHSIAIFNFDVTVQGAGRRPEICALCARRINGNSRPAPVCALEVRNAAVAAQHFISPADGRKRPLFPIRPR